MLTVNEVAKKCNVTPRTVRRWIAEGKLEVYQANANCAIRISQEQLDKFWKGGKG